MIAEFVSEDLPLVEQEGRNDPNLPKPPDTPERTLFWMIRRRAYYGTPLPDGYVPPPGINIEALLKRLPPYPPAPRSAG